MKVLENLACRFLIWRFRIGYGSDCNTVEDWIDGGMPNDSACPGCQKGFVVHFLKEHIEL